MQVKVVKLLTCLLSFALSVCICIANEGSAKQQRDDTGKCGSNLVYTYDSNSQTLTISGSGDMTNPSSSSDVPWASYAMSIQAVVFKGSVTSIGNYAFNLCVRLKAITIPSTVTTIGIGAFYHCQSLESITIPASVTSLTEIKINPFYGCTSLSLISVEQGNRAFKVINGALFNIEGTILVSYPSAKNVKRYDIPDSVTLIAFAAFSYCSFLHSITIPNSVTTILGCAFMWCTNLTTITIPSSVTTVENYLFDHCSNLMSIEVDPNNPSFKSIDGVLFNKEGTVIYEYPGGQGDSYTIPDNVTTVTTGAFCGRNKLKYVTIPASVTSMMEQAFHSCENLEIVSFLGTSDPGTGSVFSNCLSLRAVSVPLQYNSGTFCGVSDFCKCDALEDIENHCYQASCKNGEWNIQQRTNATNWEKQGNKCYEYHCVNKSGGESRKSDFATQWEKRTNGCIEYQCDNDKGFVWRSKCNSTESESRLCMMNDECIETKAMQYNGWSVEIDIEGMIAIETNATEIFEEIVLLTSLNGYGIDVGIEISENGDVVKIIAYVDSEEIAIKIKETVDGIKENKECEYVLCRTKRIIIKRIQPLFIEQGYLNTQSAICILFFLIIALIQ